MSTNEFDLQKALNAAMELDDQGNNWFFLGEQEKADKCHEAAHRLRKNAINLAILLDAQAKASGIN